MATAAQSTFLPLDAYLHTVYEPDMDYVDGELEDRNVGEYDHNMVQRALILWFYAREREWNIRVVQEQRTHVAKTRVRIPDISVFTRDTPVEQVFTRPQLIAIEVLSPEDRHSRMAGKIADYLRFGVRHVWIIDPVTREGWDCSSGNWIRAERFEVAGTEMHISLPDLFAKIDSE